MKVTQGVVKMKQRLRTKVWWPGIDAQAEAHCKSCHGCQVVSSPNPPPPLFRTTLPSLPWQHLAADLLGPLPSGDNILVVVDYYSRFFELYILKKVSTDAIIGCLKKAFLTHGLPYTLKTDNGPQFISDSFEDFMEQEGIIHNTSTPYWPQANGEVERQNRSLLKILRISQVEEKNWKQELQHFLMMYRSTPHSSTGKAPAEMLFGRKIRTKLPELVDFGIDDDVRDFDSVQKMKGKDYADLKRCAQHTPIQTGDKVLVRQHRENKLSSNFHPQPCTVVNRYGNAVDLESSTGGMYRRHVTHVKKYVSKPDGDVKNTNSHVSSQHRALSETAEVRDTSVSKVTDIDSTPGAAKQE
ncbi:uncharacterized protein K02A2.6-like [Haliotis rubra]|uniref:uncharacterized protein K02A2.6-like n=1 Tax=Haliotis rubra TaxID=36100 RepID=UPI001EE50769|nr:uncharacterized protein K02A2.6-like [Haliotis rubra]